MNTYLTQEEIDACQSLPRDTPYLIDNISHGIFSTARYTGGMTYSGNGYTYMPLTDECVRDDVLKLVTKLRKAAKKKAKPTETQTTIEFSE